MEQWITETAANAPYIIIFGVLLASGMGLPIPEDIPLVVGGWLAGTGRADPTIMFVGSFIAIMGADAIVFWLGRVYGHHVPKIPLLRRFLTPDRLARTEARLHRHGGKFMFTARFLPGLRAPAMFTAGTFRVPYWKFFLYDGSAAAISVPTIFFLAYAFAEHIERVKQWVASGQIVAIVTVLLLIAGFIAVKLVLKRRVAAADL